MKLTVKRIVAATLAVLMLSGCKIFGSSSSSSQPSEPVQRMKPKGVQPGDSKGRTGNILNPELGSLNRRVLVYWKGRAGSNSSTDLVGINDTHISSQEREFFENTLSSDSSISADLKALSNYSLGFHQGIFTDSNLVVKDGLGKNQLNYMFINQPYSSYGMFMNQTRDGGNGETFLRFAMLDQSTEPVSVKGSAIYKGDVIARIQHNNNSDNVVYKKDGNVEFTADFDKSRISGYLHSNSIGQVRLNETALEQNGYRGETLENNNLAVGKYKGEFSSNKKETVGYIDIEMKGDSGTSGYYNAVYGATKQ